MAHLNAEWLERSYHEYVSKWLVLKWGYSPCWEHHFPEMVLWYSAAGAARLNERAADEFLRKVRLNGIDDLPERRRQTWREAILLAREVCIQQRTNPVDWFTGGCGAPKMASERLDDIPYIGPKIAS